jgi:ABC-type transport system involved in multi-copper enzyme maturation permease subunit
MPPPPRPLLLNFVLLWRHAAARAFTGRRPIVFGILLALPVLLAWLQVKNDPGVDTSDFVGVMLMFVFQFVVPLSGLFLGVAALGDEIEGRTLTYLFTRPHPRPLVFLARYMGLAFAFALLLFVTVVFTAHIYSTRVPLTRAQIVGSASVAALGFIVYAALFAALRVFVQRALFVGFILGFIFEGGVSKLPDSGISRWSVWHHLALLETRLFDVRVASSGDLRDLLGGITPEETVVGSLVVLASVLVVSLAAGAWRVRSQETRLANAST